MELINNIEKTLRDGQELNKDICLKDKWRIKNG